MPRSPDRRPVLITDAERSPREQLRSREIRYVVMMSIRALCLILATVLAVAHVPLLWLWVPLCLAGMVLIPWFAVILANDRAPRPEHRLSNKLRRPSNEPPPEPTHALPAGHGDHKTIDVEP